MASSLPIPAPPRTPTPPTPIREEEQEAEIGGLGINGISRTVRSTMALDPNSLSPMTDTFPSRFGSMGSPMSSSANTPTFNNNTMGPPPPNAGTRSSNSNSNPNTNPNPFNFQTQTIKETPLSTIAKSVWLLPPLSNEQLLHLLSEQMYANYNPKNIGQRRGHRYKHSSVSAQHQIFLEPPPRAPLALPASLPVPTLREAWQSTANMDKAQRLRIFWCACHALVAAYVLYSASGSLAMTALSHLIFFDAISASICVAVDIFCNFEVWKRSSIRHPFGLERAEVLAGFAMSVFLLFMSFDLISHNLKHVLESLGSHQPHHPHSHHRVSPGSIDSAAVLSIVATLISAVLLENHKRIGKAMRFVYLDNLPGILSNPAHLLTLSCSTLMLILPLLSISIYIWLDRLLCTLIAIAMFLLGTRLAMAQGLMLLMSYSGAGVSEVMQQVVREPMVVGVEEARFWQVHFGLCMANLKLRVTGDETQVGKLRERIVVLVRNRLGGGYGKGSGLKWEVTVQCTIEK
ncbi:putative zinc transporter zrg17 [Lachnellula cervina]|uniref:Zinc transporter n=1 Tax=Lachnellula cervina TaxID=1316786 RepID=A0A7D8UMJ4_9HELO|nr:putative zinc transporter zrg17 [Lachnellula cervina]